MVSDFSTVGLVGAGDANYTETFKGANAPDAEGPVARASDDDIPVTC